MLQIVRFLIRLYQWTLSPVLSWLNGPGMGCRFEPSCSRYFLQAVETHGLWKGSWLGLSRLARCAPWGGHGYDPVPPIQRTRSLSTVQARRKLSGFPHSNRLVCE